MTISTETLRSASKRNDVYKSAMQGLLAWAADRIDAQTAEIARLREALATVEQWNEPIVESHGEAVPMSVAYGSNGVRDYFRGVARAALSGDQS